MSRDSVEYALRLDATEVILHYLNVESKNNFNCETNPDTNLKFMAYRIKNSMKKVLFVD